MKADTVNPVAQSATHRDESVDFTGWDFSAPRDARIDQIQQSGGGSLFPKITAIYSGAVPGKPRCTVKPKPKNKAPIDLVENIPIMGTTTDDNGEPVGIIAEIVLKIRRRKDNHGLDLDFKTSPGKFSPYAQQSVEQALSRVRRSAKVSFDDISVTLELPYRGVTLYGESLSAMVSLSVLSIVKGEEILPKTIMTGSIGASDELGTVGGVPLKILAAAEKKFAHVIIPAIPDVADPEYTTPFLMTVSPVENIQKAYEALTNFPLGWCEQPG